MVDRAFARGWLRFAGIESSASASHAPAIGDRIVIVGPSCSGKSTLARRLSAALGIPWIELDALYWRRADWIGAPDDEFIPALVGATAGERWVADGGYHRQATQAIWPRADAVIWLDLPLRTVLARMLRRSWRRWRNHDLLWGTNREPFSKFLRFWYPNSSLFAFTIATYRERRRRYLEEIANPRWSHIRFIRLQSGAAAEEFARAIEDAMAATVAPNKEHRAWHPSEVVPEAT